LETVEGRTDDLLDLPGRAGGRVTVHPIHLRSSLAADPAVVEYQIVQTADALEVFAVATASTESRAAALERKVEAALASQGVAFPVHVRLVDRIAREDGAGKLKLVKVHRPDAVAPVAGTREASPGPGRVHRG
jgi:phenylacetate-coenzyme A ligase PaaK-like adenylate-forming protein